MTTLDILPGSRFEFVTSRVFAKRLGNVASEHVIQTLDQGDLSPWGLAKQLKRYGYRVLDDSVSAVLDTAHPNVMRGFDEDLESIFGDTSDHLSAFVSAGVEDAMSAAMSIPRMDQGDALSIALSDASCEAVRRYAMHEGDDTLDLPTVEELASGNYRGQENLRYDPQLGHLSTPFPGIEKGCPVAHGRGELIENFYSLIARVTITEVEYFPGSRLYPPSDS